MLRGHKQKALCRHLVCWHIFIPPLLHSPCSIPLFQLQNKMFHLFFFLHLFTLLLSLVVLFFLKVEGLFRTAERGACRCTEFSNSMCGRFTAHRHRWWKYRNGAGELQSGLWLHFMVQLSAFVNINKCTQMHRHSSIAKTVCQLTAEEVCLFCFFPPFSSLFIHRIQVHAVKGELAACCG